MQLCLNALAVYNDNNMDDKIKKSKYDFLLYILDKGDAMVCLDARHPKVKVPKNHKNNPSLNLIFNLNFKAPIKITKDGIFSTLSFQGNSFACTIPFEAVWAIFVPSLKEGEVWDENIPKEINLPVQFSEVRSSKKPSPIKVVSSKPISGNEKKEHSKKDRSHLRIIK